MSIKNLFTDFRNNSRNYAEYNTEKGFFKDVESISNALALQVKATTFVPQIDYSKPTNFIKFGSAELYYEGALNKIVDFYPYDGSEAEKNNFYNSLFEGEKYIIDNLYPRFTGYAKLSADGWGALDGSITDGYGTPVVDEHITFKGGPHSTSNTNALSTLTNNPQNNKYQSSNLYDETLYKTAGLPNDYGDGTRLSNLKSNFDTGVTVEFWLKATNYTGISNSKTRKQVIFDLWNNESDSSDAYGRLRIEIDSTGTSKFKVTSQSGSSAPGGYPWPAEIGTSTTTSGFISEWHHYAFRFYNDGNDLVIKLYVDGKLDDTNIYTDKRIGEITTSEMTGRIGALVGSLSGSNVNAGAGKLSADIDEFRFWKSDRNAREIAINHIAAIGGGTNTDVSNTTLGVYFKFNEGITTNSTIDSTVLDYSGRISNGTWTGYTANSRNTGSAIVSASAAEYEYREPVIYSSHPDFVSLRNELQFTGSAHDLNNNSSFLTYAPSWVIDEHEDVSNKNLKIISHIVGTYFDKMYLLSKEMPKFRHATYTTASSSPVPFASHLPPSLGMYVPELFVDSTILEKFKNRSETKLHQADLTDVKNLIYLNLYNNLTNIFKSKGTEKAIKNVMRCFYLDDELLKLKTYNVNATYELNNNFSQYIVEKNGINFNNPNNTQANVYQRVDSTNGDSSGYLSGSIGSSANNTREKLYGFTLESDILFPNYFTRYDNINRDFVTSSLFGIYGVDESDADSLSGVDTTFLASDVANFQVYAVRDAQYSKNVYFKLTSSNVPKPIPELTSSDFPNVYDNTRWNISVRIEPNWQDKIYDEAPTYADKDYKVIFRGVNDVLGTTANEFEVSGTISNAVAQSFLEKHKRVYVGAEKTNLTGLTINKSDVVVLNCRAWAKSIKNSDLLAHNYGSENSGIENAGENISPLYEDKNFDLTNLRTLALDWTFNNVTGSDSAGNFIVQDASSGSAMIREQYGWLGKATGFQHTGYGHGFATSSDSVVEKRRINSFKTVDPEQVVSSDMVNVLSQDDQVIGIDQTVPSYLFTIEKNIYEAISSEMLTFFAGVIDFNNLIGNPVNRYRERYKDMEKLRDVFFQKVQTVTEAEKYFEYYKWFDDAITKIIKQLLPASGDGLDKVMNIIESHALERNKYKTPFPTIESKDPTISGVLYGVTEKSYPYAVGFSSLPRSPRDTTIRSVYWRDRAERTHPDISSGDSTIDAHREIYRKVIVANPHLERFTAVLFGEGSTYTPDVYGRRVFIKTRSYKVNKAKIYKGGSNFDDNKNIQFAYDSVAPQGPVNVDCGKRYIPLNVLLAFMSDLTDIKTNNDPKPENIKTKRHIKVLSGREYEQGIGYKNLKSSTAFPFSIYETTVTSGHQALLTNKLTGANIQITNLHNDVYGSDLEKPIQGPFTEENVGGHQSRHVKLNTGTDSNFTRPEAWRIVVGTCTDTIPSGSIGLVGPDYPIDVTHVCGKDAYPYKPYQKAVYYRDMTAKRPVNIKNIRIVPGTKTLGNYTNTYEYIQTVGAYQNPRKFVDNQPALPSVAFANRTTSSTSVRTFMDIKRTSLGHSENVSEYSTSYLTGTANKSIIVSRFSSPGGIEVMSRGYQDFKSSEFSVYNSINYRNMTVLKPSQGPSGTISTPAESGDTTDIQVYDIHGKDYGLYSHLARHTARFGRDSLHVLDSEAGQTYEQLPGFHKIHRNNLDKPKIISTVSTPVYGGLSLTNNRCIVLTPESSNVTLLHTSSVGSSTTPLTLINNITSSGGEFSWSGWIKFGEVGPSDEETIFALGQRESQNPLFRLVKTYGGTDYKIQLWIRTANNPAGDGVQSSTMWNWSFAQSSTYDFTGSWNHFVLTWDSVENGQLTSSAAFAQSAARLYFNGTLQPSASITPGDRRYYNQRSGSNALPIRNFSSQLRYGNEFMSIGGDCQTTAQTRAMTGSIDEYSFWLKTLDQSNVNVLYNGGTPCDIIGEISASNLPDHLWDWLRFDSMLDAGGASYTAINALNLGVYNAANNAVVGYKGEAFVPLAISGTSNTMTNSEHSSLGFPLTGCAATLLRYEDIHTYASRSSNDNYYVQRPIPRSTKQYSWINNSIVNDNFWVGYAPREFLIRSSILGRDSEEYIPIYDFVSGSEAGSSIPTPGPTSAGRRHFPRQPEAEHIPQVSDLNLNIYEPINLTTNTIGYSTTVPLAATDPANTQYINTDLVEVVDTPTNAQGPAFNNLMFKRGNQYGYNSWNQLRQADNPIIRNEKATNTISAVGKDGKPDNIVTYELPAISNRGMANTIHFNSAEGKNFVIKATHENEKIYFSSVTMDNVLAPQLNGFATPFDNMVEIGKSKHHKINWIINAQQVFPSIRNEFTTRSYTKKHYNNEFWRDNREERNQINATLNTYDDSGEPTFVGAPPGAYVSTNAMGYYCSQSAWVLDPPSDFLTRTTAFVDTEKTGSSAIFHESSPGQLQNGYTYYLHLSMSLYSASAGAGEEERQSEAMALQGQYLRTVGPVYARPHDCEIRTSMVSPTGPRSPYVDQDYWIVGPAALSSSFKPENRISASLLGGGAAFWDAPANAGYHQTNAAGELEFISRPSKPWFNTYDDYNFDLKLMAKGFSVIPEYRISENVSDYIRNRELDNPYQPLELEIPHVPGADTQNDGSFYISYSNSEFLKDFLKIKREALLNATEIKLSCIGAIRFNPYKGFYPAQRTINLVEQFKDSYQENFGATVFETSVSPGTSSRSPLVGPEGFNPGTSSFLPSVYRPLVQPLYSPGILYNSIKSGMAVDFPIVTTPEKVVVKSFNEAVGPNPGVGGNTEYSLSSSAWGVTFNQELSSSESGRQRSLLINTSSFFDERLPFETLLEPVKHLAGKSFIDMESNPRTRLVSSATASFVANVDDEVYPEMARNFFGAVPSFFLKDSSFTGIKSSVKTDSFVFSGSEVYMMRVKMNRSTEGVRTYAYEPDGRGNTFASAGTNCFFTPNGARPFSPGIDYLAGGFYEIPQDPRFANTAATSSGETTFKETFTMYSRPSAFGPNLPGRPFLGQSLSNSAGIGGGPYPDNGLTPSAFTASFDTFSGFNPAYTPPYYNGEAWADLVFRPQADKTYKIEDIISETKAIYRRFEAGRYANSTGMEDAGSSKALIYECLNEQYGPLAPYSGASINDAAMQLNASINLFGVEKMPFTERDKFGDLQSDRPGQSVGQRWVIRPKFETPMMNFANITGSQITYPTSFGGNQVAKGMWHQFGRLPREKEGVFLSVEDIPKTWLRYHYDVIEFRSDYNDGRPNNIQYDDASRETSGITLNRRVKSLADLVGFNKNKKVRLGELKQKTVLHEAIIAIPYIIEATTEVGMAPGTTASENKKFISIPKERFEAAQREAIGSVAGDSFVAAGTSISKQLQKMQRYILPPQFDFINNPETSLDPFVMYIFEFNYELDRDDLSYIWQNLAPRDYEKITYQHQSVAHVLADNEILSERILEENQNLRWMIFKVKQKGQEDYWDYVDEQAKTSTKSPAIKEGLFAYDAGAADDESNYKLRHNWPYDYVSFVEMIKMNVEIKYDGSPVKINDPQRKVDDMPISNDDRRRTYKSERQRYSKTSRADQVINKEPPTRSSQQPRRRRRGPGNIDNEGGGNY